MLALGRQAYTVTPSTEVAPDHLGSNVTIAQYPKRTWWDDGTGVGSTLVVALTTPGPLVACVLYGGTVTSWAVEESADGVSGWAAIPESPVAVGTDERFQHRRKGWRPITTTQGFLRFTVGTLAAGATRAELGVLDLYADADVITLTQNPSAPLIEPVTPESVFEPQGGGFQVNEDGAPYALYDLSGAWFRKYGVVEQLHTINNVGRSHVVALYENHLNTAHVYLGRIRRMLPVGREAARVETGLLFREVA
jgi:hypothetical protein